MIRKITYELTVDGKSFKLLSFEVSHSIYTPTQTAILTVDKKPNLYGKVNLKLGTDQNNSLIFKGFIIKIDKLQNKYKIYADNTYHLQNNIKTISLKNVDPKQILNHIGISNLKYTQKNLMPKHHFPILNKTPFQVVKEIIKAWNLKNFVFYMDKDLVFHFHHKNEFWEKIHEVFLPVVKNTENKITLPLSTNIYVNEKVKIKDKTYKVVSVFHAFGKTILEVEENV